MGSVLNKINNILGIGKLFKGRPEQHTFIYCEACSNELCSSDSFVSDTYDDRGWNRVLYRCSRCGHECLYDFDVAPLPIKWSELGRTP